MIKRVLGILMAGMVVLATGLSLSRVCYAEDLKPNMDICSDLTDDELREAAGCDVDKDKTAVPAIITLIQVALTLMGLVAVAVIIYGGFTYMTSLGDASKVQRAKNAILYGIVGMVVALLAFTIVHFVSQSVWG